MSVSVKISQLIDGGALTSNDYLPISRGAAETYKIAASQIVTAGVNIGGATGTVFRSSVDGVFGRTLQFRTLQGIDGITVVPSGDTLVVSASGQNPIKTSITGDGTRVQWPLQGDSFSINPNNYRVDIDGVLQESVVNYNIVGSNIVFVTSPPNGSKITVVSNNLLRAFDVTPSDNSVTPQKLSTGGPAWNTAGQVQANTLRLTNLPTSSAGLPSGSVWRDVAAGNVLKIVP